MALNRDEATTLRTAAAAVAAAIWRHVTLANAADVEFFANNPTPLPPGTLVVVCRADGQFDVFWLE
ncbi:hypothetical protein ABZ419_04375 [Streptomyces cinnamoneus]|uniref:hypothetical protein n=1 Tax=Streptomyces cinnamoneus TaxID=53446 RepID=UPI0033F35E94